MLQLPLIEYEQAEPIYISKILPNGKRLIIIGEAEQGTLYEPFYVYNEAALQQTFGSGPLLDRYREITQNFDSVDMYVMRIEPQQFQTAYQALMPFEFDFVYIDDFNFGSSQEEILRFVEFAEDKANQGYLIHGIVDLMNFHDLNDLQDVKAWIENLTLEYEYDTYDRGKFLSVVCPQFGNIKAGSLYAGLLMSLDPEVSPVNKPLNVPLKRVFSNHELMNLDQMGIVTFRNSLKRNTVCASATCAVTALGSPNKHIANFRIVQLVIADLTDQLKEYVGRLNVLNYKNEIDNKISQVLLTHKMANRIKNYSYQFKFDTETNNVFIELYMVPIFSIDHIHVKTQLRVFR